MHFRASDLSHGLLVLLFINKNVFIYLLNVFILFCKMRKVLNQLNCVKNEQIISFKKNVSKLSQEWCIYVYTYRSYIVLLYKIHIW